MHIPYGMKTLGINQRIPGLPHRNPETTGFALSPTMTMRSGITWTYSGGDWCREWPQTVATFDASAQASGYTDRSAE